MQEPANRESVLELFHRCSGLPPAERQALLEKEGISALMRQELEELFAYDQSGTESFFQPVPAARELFSEIPPLFEPGTLVGGTCRVVDFIRRGGMGEVYSALEGQGTKVAVKAIRPLYGYTDDSMKRFRKEFQVQAKLHHPNICRVLQLGQHSDERGTTDFFTMEFLDGVTLAGMIRQRGRLAPELALEIGRGILAGLECAHAANIIHRDLKPSNVIVLTGQGYPARAVLLDFGLARIADRSEADTALTRTGERPGTANYMSPEQAAGKQLDCRTDLYSFGLLIFEMISGERAIGEPAARDSPQAPLERRIRLLPPPWRDAIAATLEPDPADRPRSAAEVRLLLEGSARRPWLRIRAKVRRRTAIAALGVAALGGGAAAWSGFRKHTLARGVKVLVADAAGTDSDVTGAVTIQLRRLLAESGWVAVWPAEKIADVWSRMGRQGTPQPGEKDWTEIALRENVPLVVFPSISGPGLTLRVSRAQRAGGRPSTDVSPVFPARADGEWLPALDGASRWIRDYAGESAAEIAQSAGPEAVTTSSWLALKAYSAGERQADQREWDAALDGYSQALRIDSDFTMAWIRTADVLVSLGREKSGFSAWAKAVDSAKRRPLTKREELYSRGMLALDSADYAQGEQLFGEFERAFPDDWRGPFFRALPLTMTGRNEEAIQKLKNCLRFPERVWRAHMQLAWNLAGSLRFEEAQSHVAELRRLNRPSAAGWAEAVAHYLQGRTRECLAALGEAAKDEKLMTPPSHRVYRSSVLADGGETESALRETRDSLKIETVAGNRAQRTWQIISAAWLLEDLGRRAESDTLLESLDTSEMGPRDLARAGTLHARAGRPGAARTLQAELDGQPTFAVHEIARATMKGEIALAEGRVSEGINALRDAARIDSRSCGKEYLAHGLKRGGEVPAAQREYNNCASYKLFQLRLLSPEPAGVWRRIQLASKG